MTADISAAVLRSRPSSPASLLPGAPGAAPGRARPAEDAAWSEETAHLGVRWEDNLPWTDRYDNISYFDTNASEHHHFFVEGEDALVDIPGAQVLVDKLPTAPDGYEIARVDVVVRLRRKQG